MPTTISVVLGSPARRMSVLVEDPMIETEREADDPERPIGGLGRPATGQVEVTPNTTIIRKPTCTDRTIWLGSGLKVAVTIWNVENATAIQNSARPSKSLPQPFSRRASVLVWPGIGVP